MPTITTNQQRVETWHKEWLEARAGHSPKEIDLHWGDRINWVTADDIARRLDEAIALEPESCDKAPPGWYCTREKGHDGPCAAQSNLFD